MALYTGRLFSVPAPCSLLVRCLRLASRAFESFAAPLGLILSQSTGRAVPRINGEDDLGGATANADQVRVPIDGGVQIGRHELNGRADIEHTSWHAS